MIRRCGVPRLLAYRRDEPAPTPGRHSDGAGGEAERCGRHPDERRNRRFDEDRPPITQDESERGDHGSGDRADGEDSDGHADPHARRTSAANR